MNNAINQRFVPTCTDLVPTYFAQVGTAKSRATAIFERHCTDRTDRFPYTCARTHARARAHTCVFIKIGRYVGTKYQLTRGINGLGCTDLGKIGRYKVGTGRYTVKSV